MKTLVLLAYLTNSYSLIVTKPMDLSSIQARLDNGVYATRDDFVKDVKQIVENCKAYNQPKGPVWKEGELFDAFFNKSESLCSSPQSEKLAHRSLESNRGHLEGERDGNRHCSRPSYHHPPPSASDTASSAPEETCCQGQQGRRDRFQTAPCCSDGASTPPSQSQAIFQYYIRWRRKQKTQTRQ